MSATESLGDSLRELREFLERRKWSYCLIGGLAANRWGEPRFTRDIDIVVFSGIGDEEKYVDAMLAEFAPRPGIRDMRGFALQNRVLLLQSNSGVPIDVSLGALEFEDHMTMRAEAATIVKGQKFRVASAEDVVIMKVIAGRPQDWQDVEGIVVKQGRKLDWDYIHENLDPLLESMEAPQRSTQLSELRTRLEPNVNSQANRPRRGRKKKGDS
jgi:hypothetical protein